MAEVETLCRPLEMARGDVLLLEQALVHGSHGNSLKLECVVVVLLIALKSEPIVMYLRRHEHAAIS